METIKKYLGAFFSALLVLLAALFFYEKKKANDATAKLENADYDKDSAIIKDKISTLSKERQAILAAASIEKGRPLTLEELKTFFDEELKEDSK